MVVPGSSPVHDLVDLGLGAVSVNATTLGGLLTEALGRLPVAGDTVEIRGNVFDVLEVRRHTATRPLTCEPFIQVRSGFIRTRFASST